MNPELPKGRSYEYIGRLYSQENNPEQKYKVQIGDSVLIMPTKTSCGQGIYPCVINEKEYKHVFPYPAGSKQIVLQGTGDNSHFCEILSGWKFHRVKFLKRDK